MGESRQALTHLVAGKGEPIFMRLADYHTHSNCSPDGFVSMSEMAESAWKAGVQALCLTDHCDFLTLEGARNTVYDWQPPLAQFQEMVQKFGQHLDLRLGLEFGVGFLDASAAETVLAQPALDFVIGSVHNLQEKNGGLDFYCLDYSTEQACYDALDDYVISMQRLAESPYYDILGHIIYPIRYMKGCYERPIAMDRYTDQLRTLLTTVVSSGRGIEINTWRGQTLAEWYPVLQLYQDCGGEILTLGSDAHQPRHVALGLKDVYPMLEDLGFRYVAEYQGRKPQMMKI